MPLPSGTAISAADINTHLGRTSGTAVDWNTTVRTLSNNNTTPNLGDARGRSARHLQHTTGYTSDLYGNYYSNSPLMRIEAHSIPNTPWRVLINSSTITNGTSYHAINITVIGTHHDVKYTYTLVNNTAALGVLGSNNTYFSPGLNTAMLANGKLVLFSSVGTDASATTGDRGIGFLVITFATDGQINSCKSYVSALSNVPGNSLYNSGIFKIIKSSEVSVYGNKFVTAVTRFNTAYSGILIHVDLSSDSPILKYAKINDNTDTTNESGLPGSGEFNAIYVNANKVAVYRNPYLSYTSHQTAVCTTDPTASTISWTASNRWGLNTSAVTIETGAASPYQYYSFSLPTSQVYTVGCYVDKRNYYYHINCHAQQLSGAQVAPTRYYTGTISAITIQKINPDTNATVFKIVIGGRNYNWSEYYSDKYGSGYNYFNTDMISTYSIQSIETDASGNTYILYKTSHFNDAGQLGTSPVVITSISAPPSTQQVLYHISKYNSSGGFLWNKVIDLGSRAALLCPYTNVVVQGSELIIDGSDSWSMIPRDDIGVLEIHCQAPLRNSSNTTYWEPINTKNLRSAHLLMSTGDSITDSTAYTYSHRLNMYSDITSTGSTINQAQRTSSTFAPLIFPMHSRSTISYDNSVASTSVYSNSAGWWTETLSVGSITSSPFTSNATAYTLGYIANATNDQ